MNIEEFRTEVAECIRNKSDNEYTLILNNVVKNNGVVLHGITFKKSDRNIAPTLYMENYCREEYEFIIENAVNRIISDVGKSWCSSDFDYEFFSDFNKVRDRLFVKLINTGKNKELLYDVPSRSFLDLSLVVYCNVEDICNMNASILVRSEHMRAWGVDEDTLIDVAYDNTRRIGAKINDIVDYFEQGTTKCADESISSLVPERGLMYVMTNKMLNFGAVCMTFDDSLDEFYNRISSGFYIIPSSIHEVLLVPSNGTEESAEGLSSIIGMVNEESLSIEEVLSDHAYYYSPEEGYISL